MTRFELTELDEETVIQAGGEEEITLSVAAYQFEPLIDRLIVHFTGETWRAEVATAKKEFFLDAGIMDEQTDHFEMRMTQFLDWYLFSRLLTGRTVTPSQYALEIDEFQMTADERVLFECLAETHHSLFEFLRLRGRDIYVRDLILDKEIVVRDSQVNIGFSRDEIFEARLVPYGADFIFARSFCFHPVEARSFIDQEVHKLQEVEFESEAKPVTEAFLLRLMKMRYKYEQFRHLKLEYIYTNEKKVRF
ncbi:MAG: hypothetical protein RBT63_05340 [Bdellovibrionales bacterium]|jgi:hypothetical protein|nr:hypothetical protein [Bdellovibrionales bacterium]